MKTVGIKVLKNRLSEYVRAAAAGETDRDRVVAELVAPRRTDTSVDAMLDQDAREGWYSPPETAWSEPVDEPEPADDPPIAFEVLMQDLRRDRDER